MSLEHYESYSTQRRNNIEMRVAISFQIEIALKADAADQAWHNFIN